MPRENREAKGRRLLTEGRLTVLRVSESGFIHATCRGDSGAVYDLGSDSVHKRWGCTCPCKGTCSHLVALKLVTVAR